MSAIEARGLVKRFGKTTAVDDVSFTVEAGEVFGLLGPNGAGKTTTFGMLCGWLRADAGHATVLGQPCSAIHRLRGRATALPQDATFAPDLSLVRQLRHYALLSGVAPEAADRAAMEALERVGLADAAGKKGDELSHGMAKRAGIAQAFVGNAEVVFLDEPTAGLDPLNAKQVREIIASQRGVAPSSSRATTSRRLRTSVRTASSWTTGRSVRPGRWHSSRRRARMSAWRHMRVSPLR